MTENTNPLLGKVKLPGRHFELPSKGVYPDGVLAPDLDEGAVHVHAMTAIDEINIKNPDMLFSGKAVEIVCRSCIPDIRQPLELYAKDVDAIMIFLRVVTYGPIYNIEFTHDCEGAKSHDYQVNLEEIIRDSAALNLADPNSNVVQLPNGQAVKLQPVKYGHVIRLLKANEGKMNGTSKITSEDVQKSLVSNLLSVIDSIDDVKNDSAANRRFIEEWIKSIPPTYVNRIVEKMDLLNEWGPKTTLKFKCKDCGADVDVDIPLNPISFFTE